MSDSNVDLKKVYRLRFACGIAVACLLSVAAFLGLPNFIPYKLQICAAIALGTSCCASIIWAEKNKTIATLAAMSLVVPMDYIYLNQVNLDDPISLVIRAVPIVGNVYSMWRIHISKTLKPEAGWSSNIF
jgi:predicted neutral ceramidase superfamily lipid hydrolase